MELVEYVGYVGYVEYVEEPDRKRDHVRTRIGAGTDLFVDKNKVVVILQQLPPCSGPARPDDRTTVQTQAHMFVAKCFNLDT